MSALACPQCHALVHAAELNALAGEARSLEAKDEPAKAREVWHRSLALLPSDSKQAEWVRDRIGALGTASPAEPAAGPERAWARKLGPLAPLAILLAKSKGLILAIFKLKFLLSFFAFIAIYAAMFGWRYGLGIAACILIHEMGHFVDIKRRGLPAEMPVFLPGLGAYVRWNALGVTRRQVAEISLAGPLAGWLAAAVCYLLYLKSHDPVWAALARTGAWLNLINLVPVWTLDGAQAMPALGLVERVGLLATALTLWAYTGEFVFFLLVLGVGWRLFTKDKSEQGDWRTWLYFAGVMIALGFIVHLVPDTAGRPALP